MQHTSRPPVQYVVPQPHAQPLFKSRCRRTYDRSRSGAAAPTPSHHSDLTRRRADKRLSAVLDAPRTAASEPAPAAGFASIPGVAALSTTSLRSVRHRQDWPSSDYPQHLLTTRAALLVQWRHIRGGPAAGFEAPRHAHVAPAARTICMPLSCFRRTEAATTSWQLLKCRKMCRVHAISCASVPAICAVVSLSAFAVPSSAPAASPVHGSRTAEGRPALG
jgi:hypothetical protein